MKNRMKLVVGNWKMNPKTLSEAKEIFKAIKKAAAKLKGTTTVVCPPFLYVSELAKLAKEGAGVGVQNVFWETSGPYTGEVSAEQACEAGAVYAIIGHSERRALGETDEAVSKKMNAVLRARMMPILCVGERERDKEGKYLEVLAEQTRKSLSGVVRRDLSEIAIAYEPVWAIGKREQDAITGRDLYETVLYLRKVLTGMYGKDYAFNIPILYGGSVTAHNALDIVAEGQVDGLLVGRQSLEPEGFAKVLKTVDSLQSLQISSSNK